MIAEIFISGLAFGEGHKGLETVLARADRGKIVLPAMTEQAILGAMGFADVAVASCRALSISGLNRAHYTLCADPVHLIPNRDQLIMDNPAHLQLSEAETNQLLSEINTHFADDGIEIMPLSRRQWLLSVADNPCITAPGPDELIGMHIMDHLPKGDNAIKWHAWLTEVQSLLHLSSVNQQREDRGLPVVNSLWLWGAGKSYKGPRSEWSHVYADDALVRGLVESTNCLLSGSDTIAWENLTHADKLFAVITPEVVQKQVGELESMAHYHGLVYDLWLKPAVDAIRKKKVTKLIIYSESCAPFIVHRSCLWRWWRRRKPASCYRVEPS